LQPKIWLKFPLKQHKAKISYLQKLLYSAQSPIGCPDKDHCTVFCRNFDDIKAPFSKFSMMFSVFKKKRAFCEIPLSLPSDDTGNTHHP
jgi:hypothetical protein